MVHPLELREVTPSGVTLRFCRNRVTTVKGDLVLFHHWHEQYEVIYINQGNIMFHIDGEIVEARAGEAVFVPPNCLHGGYNAADGDVEYVAIVFSPELLASIGYDLQFEQFIAPFLTGKMRFPLLQSTDRDNASAVFIRTVSDAIQHFEGGAPVRDLIFKYQLQFLFAAMANRYYHDQRDRHRAPAMPLHHMEALKKLIQHIESNYSETITVESAAKMVNLSPFHFCKMFKRMTGRTLIDFVNLHRINQATILLRETDFSVADIAERIGCCNANYFSKLYFRYKGVSPSVARKTN